MADAYSANVVFLARFSIDGAVTTMLDRLGLTMTGYGNATVITEADSLTGHYLLLDGTGDYLTVPGIPQFQLGAGDFAIDMGLETTTTDTKCLLDFWDGASAGWLLQIDSTGKLVFGNPATVLTSNSAVNDGNRHHIQVCRYSGTLYMYIDGTRQANTTSLATNFNTTSPLLSIGAQVTSRNTAWDFPGKIDFVRITVGASRGNGASTITPPTLAGIGLLVNTAATDALSVGEAAGGSRIMIGDSVDQIRLPDAAVGSYGLIATSGIGLTGNVSTGLLRVGTATENMQLASSLSAKGSFRGTATDTIDLADTAKGLMTAMVQVVDGFKMFEAQTVAGLIDDALSVWVANVATAAHSRYAQYGFNSFARFGGKHYGCKSDGIYLLDGNADGAAPIKWTVTFPESDFGSSNLKRFESVYIGAKATGQIVLKVVQDAAHVYHYNVTPSGNDARAARALLGRGSVGRYWQFELASDTERVELDSIDYSFSILSRRI